MDNYRGVIIEESLKNKDVLNKVQILETKISLYPNPAKNNFNIQFPNNYMEESEITILNTNGQVVKKQTVTEKDLVKSHRIEFNGLNSGFYFVKIESSKLSKTIKLIVQ
jgi:hypothetical protein